MQPIGHRGHGQRGGQQGQRLGGAAADRGAAGPQPPDGILGVAEPEQESGQPVAFRTAQVGQRFLGDGQEDRPLAGPVQGGCFTGTGQVLAQGFLGGRPELLLPADPAQRRRADPDQQRDEQDQQPGRGRDGVSEDRHRGPPGPAPAAPARTAPVG